MIRAGEFCLFYFFRGGWYNLLKLKMFCKVSLWGFQRLRSWPTGLDLGRSPKCKGGGTGRERWSVRVRALLSPRDLLTWKKLQPNMLVCLFCLSVKTWYFLLCWVLIHMESCFNLKLSNTFYPKQSNFCIIRIWQWIFLYFCEIHIWAHLNLKVVKSVFSWLCSFFQ